MKYDETELINLLEVEPQEIIDESGIYWYETKDKFEMILFFSLDSFNESCSISLSHTEKSIPVVELEFSKIMEISVTDESFQIISNNNLNIWEFFIKPYFYVREKVFES